LVAADRVVARARLLTATLQAGGSPVSPLGRPDLAPDSEKDLIALAWSCERWLAEQACETGRQVALATSELLAAMREHGLDCPDQTPVQDFERTPEPVSGTDLLEPTIFAWRDQLTGDASLFSSLEPRASSHRAGEARAGFADPAAVLRYSRRPVRRVSRHGWLSRDRGTWWSLWPHVEERLELAPELDAVETLRSLRDSLHAGRRRLEDWRRLAARTLEHRFVAPLGRLQQELREEVEALARKATLERRREPSLQTALGRLEPLHREALSEERSLRLARAGRGPAVLEPALLLPPREEPLTQAKARPLPRRPDPFAWLLASFRDHRFHRAYLRALAATGTPRPSTVAILGLTAADRWELAQRFLYRLRANSGHTPKPNWPGSPRTQPAFAPANWVSACVPNSQLAVAPDDDDEAWQRFPTLRRLDWADLVILLVDLPRLEGALAQLDRAPYAESLPGARARVIYACPHGALLLSRLPELALRLLPRLFEAGPCGPRPCVVHEGYDTRYTDFAEQLETVRSGREMLGAWRAAGLSFAPPFTPAFVERQAELALSRARTDPEEHRDDRAGTPSHGCG
jgi:hypothetical protein